MIRLRNIQRRYVSHEVETNDEGATIARVTHSPGHADIATRRIDMLHGRIVASAIRAI